MKKTLSLVLSIVFIISSFSVFAYADSTVDRIDITVYSDIGQLNYKDAQYIYTIDTEGFKTLERSSLKVYYDDRPYYESFYEGETYLLGFTIYCEGKMDIGEDFDVYVNGEKLTALEDYIIVYNPESNRTLIQIAYSITVTGFVLREVLKCEITVPDSTTIGWKNKASICASVKDFPSLGLFEIAWYEGDKMISANKVKSTGNGLLTEPFVTEPLTSEHTYTAKIVYYNDYTGQYQIMSRQNQEKAITITVKTGFFDKIIYFFQHLFGKDTVELKAI